MESWFGEDNNSEGEDKRMMSHYAGYGLPHIFVSVFTLNGSIDTYLLKVLALSLKLDYF